MSTQQRYRCPCCGHLTLDEQPPGTYEVCAVCLWEDDIAQFENPDLAGGANDASLAEARRNFASFGASATEHKQHVRRPTPSEMPPEKV